MALRKLFCDMAGDLQNRLFYALDRMMAWASEGKHTSSVFSFDVQSCIFAYNLGIEEVFYLNGRWLLYKNNGQYYDASTIGLVDLANIVDWIERKYSPDHKCGHGYV